MSETRLRRNFSYLSSYWMRKGKIRIYIHIYVNIQDLTPVDNRKRWGKEENLYGVAGYHGIRILSWILTSVGKIGENKNKNKNKNKNNKKSKIQKRLRVDNIHISFIK
jgi:hypothetical protein